MCGSRGILDESYIMDDDVMRVPLALRGPRDPVGKEELGLRVQCVGSGGHIL